MFVFEERVSILQTESSTGMFLIAVCAPRHMGHTYGKCVVSMLHITDRHNYFGWCVVG